MEGADKSTGLWRHPYSINFNSLKIKLIILIAKATPWLTFFSLNHPKIEFLLMTEQY